MYKSQIKSELNGIIEKIGVQEAKFTVEKPGDERFGDYATNAAMTLAKKLKKAPLEIAKDIAVKFPKLDFIGRIEIEQPGFINFHLKKETLVENLDKITRLSDQYGSSDYGKGTKIILEHTNVNPNKALHVGHLRSACLGSACEKILEFLGYDVEVEYYVDDTGVQVAVSALGVKELGLEVRSDEKYDHYAGRAYVEAMKKLENSKKLTAQKDKIIDNLDKQEGGYLAFLKEFVEKVIRANLETVRTFDIDYDVLIWESEILKSEFWEKTFEILKLSSNFYQSKTGKNKGCWVLKNVSEKEKVIVKSNGVVTYTGKDIAYHLWKFNLLGKDFKYKKWPSAVQKKPLWTTDQNGRAGQKFGHADRVINFIDARQSFPQQVVKSSLEVLGYDKAAHNLKHVGYGIVSLAPKTAKELGVAVEEGKGQYAMSGRAGIAVLADDLLDMVKKKLKQKHNEAPQPEKIAVAAIKYLMLVYNPYSDIVFSNDKALDIYGNSGPYLQYAYARCQSVLKKASRAKKCTQYSEGLKELHLSEEETSVLRWIIHFPEVVMESGKQHAPNLLCNFLFELAGRFNTFYHKRPIVRSKKGPESIKFRLLLTAATAQVLKNGLGLLGIERLERM